MLDKKKRLKAKLEEKKKQLLKAASDYSFSKKVVEEILALQKQIDVEETYVSINMKDALIDGNGKRMEYQIGAFKLIKTKVGIILSANGFDMIVRPWQQTLYGQLDVLISIQQMGDEVAKEEKELYDNYVDVTLNIFAYPLLCFYDESWIETATFMVKKLDGIFEKIEQDNLQDEDVEADEKFKEEVMFSEDIKKQIKEEE